MNSKFCLIQTILKIENKFEKTFLKRYPFD